MKKKVLEGKGCREQQVLAQVVKHSPPQKKMEPSKRVPKPKTKKKRHYGGWQRPKTKNKNKTKDKKRDRIG